MLTYEISKLIPELISVIPILVNTLSVIAGIFIANIFWKARIHRYAKTEIVETLEYQKNKIKRLEDIVVEKDSTIGLLRGQAKIAKLSALKILRAEDTKDGV